MKDIILVTENWKGTETNMLLTFEDYMKDIVFYTHKERMGIALETLELERTREIESEWVENYLSANKLYSARYCFSFEQLKKFLSGRFNDNQWGFRFDQERSSQECIAKLDEVGLTIDGTYTIVPEQKMEPREYEVEIKEVLSRLESVQADSLDDAIDKVMEMYRSEEIVLDAEDFVGVDFLPSEQEKSKIMKNLRSR